MLKDFKGFKKIGGDAKHTLMRHEQGHEIKIAHSALSPKMRAKLAELPHADPKNADKTAPIKMAEGGEIYEKDEYGNIVGKKKKEEKSEAGAAISKSFKDALGFSKGGQIPGGPGSPYMDKDVAKGIAKGASQSGADMERWAENLKKAFAEQGKKKMFGGGKVPEPKKEEEKKKEEKAPVSQETWDKFQKGFKQHLADGGEAELPPAQPAMPQASQPIIINIPSPQQAAQQFMPPQQPEAAPQAAMAAPEQQAPQMQQPAAPQAPMAAPQQAAQQAPDPYGVNQYQQNVSQGLDMQRKGLAGQASAESQSAKAEQRIASDQAAKQQAMLQDFQKQHAEIQSEYDNVLKDIKDDRIDPNQYFNSMDTGGKVMTVIGLMLGGFAAGFNKTENPALAMLNKQIERNIEAQKAEMGKKHNLLSVYQQKFGNLKDAEQMVRSLNEGYYLSLMQEQAAKSKDPMVKARFQQMAGELQQKNAGEMQKIAQRQTMLQGAKSGNAQPEMMINALIPEKDQHEARKEIGILQGIDEAIRDTNKAYDEVSQIGGIMGNMPFTESKAKVDANRAAILNSIRASMKGQGAISDQEMEQTIVPLLPAAGDTVAQLNQKREKLLNIISSKRSGAAPTLTGYGIPTTFEGQRPKSQFTHLPPKL